MITGSQSLFGQITGWVKGKETNHNCSGASVYLLRTDSSLLGQTRSRKDGNFILDGPVSLGTIIC